MVISNMYPSGEDPVFGVFVKNFFDYLEQHNIGGRTKLIAIKRRHDGVKQLIQLIIYIKFYYKILLSCMFRKWDLIYVHTISFPIVPLRIAFMFRRLPLAFNIHGSDLITHSRLAEKLKRMSFPLLKKAKLIVVPSTVFKKALMENLPEIDERRVYVSPSGGVDTQLFMPMEKLHNNTIVLGFVSHIIAMKGWRLFIEAIKKLRQNGYDVRGIIAGDGSEESELREILKEESYKDVITYLGGVPQLKLPEVYNQFDLFIFPSLFCESLGLVGLEAMACGVPVIGSDNGGPTEYIKNDENGYLFEQGNVNELVKQIEKYIGLSLEKKEDMSLKARKLAESYDRDIVMDNLLDKIIVL